MPSPFRCAVLPEGVLGPAKEVRAKGRGIRPIGSKTFDCGINKVALERDFNRLDIEGIEPDAFEKAMASFESEAARFIVFIVFIVFILSGSLHRISCAGGSDRAGG